jgi:hypothetical protein
MTPLSQQAFSRPPIENLLRGSGGERRAGPGLQDVGLDRRRIELKGSRLVGIGVEEDGIAGAGVSPELLPEQVPLRLERLDGPGRQGDRARPVSVDLDALRERLLRHGAREQLRDPPRRGAPALPLSFHADDLPTSARRRARSCRVLRARAQARSVPVPGAPRSRGGKGGAAAARRRPSNVLAKAVFHGAGRHKRFRPGFSGATRRLGRTAEFRPEAL